MRAIVNGQRYPEGTGKSKKEAKLNAAKNALDAIKNTPNTEPVSTNMLYSLKNILFTVSVCACMIKIILKGYKSYNTYFDYTPFTDIFLHIYLYIHMYLFT